MNGTSRSATATESRVASELHFSHETHTASGATRVTSRKPRLLVLTNEEPNQRGGKDRLERLETENAELRDKAVELALQIQALRDSISVPPFTSQPAQAYQTVRIGLPADQVARLKDMLHID